VFDYHIFKKYKAKVFNGMLKDLVESDDDILGQRWSWMDLTLTHSEKNDKKSNTLCSEENLFGESERANQNTLRYLCQCIDNDLESTSRILHTWFCLLDGTIVKIVHRSYEGGDDWLSTLPPEQVGYAYFSSPYAYMNSSKVLHCCIKHVQDATPSNQESIAKSYFNPFKSRDEVNLYFCQDRKLSTSLQLLESEEVIEALQQNVKRAQQQLVHLQHEQQALYEEEFATSDYLKKLLFAQLFMMKDDLLLPLIGYKHGNLLFELKDREFSMCTSRENGRKVNYSIRCHVSVHDRRLADCKDGFNEKNGLPLRKFIHDIRIIFISSSKY